jgi:hypothetical protein
MALLAPNIMSTTTTFLQLGDLEQKTKSFHRCTSSSNASVFQRSTQEEKTPVPRPLEMTQQVLLLKGVKEQYTLVNDHIIPSILNPGEILVKVSRLRPGLSLHEIGQSNFLLAGSCHRPQPDRLESTVRSDSHSYVTIY